MKLIGKFIDLSGQKFGRLTVIARAEDHFRPSGKRVTRWNCICDCGNEVVTEVYGLRNGTTRSCGCYGKEQRLKANTKHGLSHTRMKRIYYNMLSRCYNSNTPKFHNHGGRGIKVCDEWLSKGDGLIIFNNWAILNGYSEDLTLDRIDNEGDYSPENCRWVTYEEQNYNRRTNRFFTINNETRTAKEWCELTGTNINTFWQRDSKGITGEALIK